MQSCQRYDDEIKQCQANRVYWEQCYDEYSYKALAHQISYWPVMAGISLNHLALRGRHELYPASSLTTPPPPAQLPLFIACSLCGRPHCTDAWVPFGFHPFEDRVRVSGGEGTPDAPFTYCCRDTSRCCRTTGPIIDGVGVGADDVDGNICSCSVQ
jgi:hypothetical protein